MACCCTLETTLQRVAEAVAHLRTVQLAFTSQQPIGDATEFRSKLQSLITAEIGRRDEDIMDLERDALVRGFTIDKRILQHKDDAQRVREKAAKKWAKQAEAPPEDDDDELVPVSQDPSQKMVKKPKAKPRAKVTFDFGYGTASQPYVSGSQPPPAASQASGSQPSQATQLAVPPPSPKAKPRPKPPVQVPVAE